MRKPRKTAGTLGHKHRSALTLLTMANHKTVKGEHEGYLSAILYLMPHDSGGGKTLCPHSTASCREMCLAGAGLSGLRRQMGAKMARTDLFLHAPVSFGLGLAADIETLRTLARREGCKPVVRLNGTSDILWERIIHMALEPDIQFMDYTKIPIEHRAPASNYHLTYSVGGAEDMVRAVGYLRAGQSVAVVAPEAVKAQLVGSEVNLGFVGPLACHSRFIDGDETDLRFLDPPGSIVLLRPKGHVITDLMRPNILQELRLAATAAA